VEVGHRQQPYCHKTTQTDYHPTAAAAHRARLWALHRLVLGGVAAPGLLPPVCVQALLPVVRVTAGAQINLEVIHPELTGDRITPA